MLQWPFGNRGLDRFPKPPIRVMEMDPLQPFVVPSYLELRGSRSKDSCSEQLPESSAKSTSMHQADCRWEGIASCPPMLMTQTRLNAPMARILQEQYHHQKFLTTHFGDFHFRLDVQRSLCFSLIRRCWAWPNFSAPLPKSKKSGGARFEDH